MKLVYTLLFCLATSMAWAQTHIPLMVNTNGNVVAPNGFWAASPVLASSDGHATNATFHPAGTNSVALVAAGEIVARDFKGRFAISASGLLARVAGGVITFADGSSASIAGGTVSLQPSATNCIMLDLRDLTIHCWKRSIDRASVYLGTVVTVSNSVSSISQPVTFEVPKTRIPRTRGRITAGQQVKVLLLGDSLTAGTGASAGNAWFNDLFDVTQSGNLAFLGDNFTYVNAGLGGAVSRWGMAVLADAVGRPIADSSSAPGFCVARNGYRNNYSTAPMLNVGQASGFLASKPSLAIVCFGANAQYNSNEELGYLETVVRKLRREGIEVVLWNGVYNTYSANALTSRQGDCYRQIADRHGAEFVDVNARVDEANREAAGAFTGATYFDGVHQNDSGQQMIANAFKSLFSVPQLPELIEPSDYRLLINVTSNWFPNHADMECMLANGTASASAGPANSIYSLAMVTGGKSAGSANYQVSAGTNVCYAFSRACAIDWFCWATSPASFDLTIAGGGWSKTGISIPSQSWGTLQSAVSYSDCITNNSGTGVPNMNGWPMRNFCLNATVTAGTVFSDAAVAYNFEGYTVPWSAMDFRGVWGEEDAAHDAAARWRYSDDVGNASVTIPFTGNGLVVYLHSFTAAGKIDGYVDGEKVYSTADTYATGSSGFVVPLQIWPRNMARTANLADNYGVHVARLVLLPSVNGSAVSPVAQNRRLAIYEAFAVDAR